MIVIGILVLIIVACTIWLLLTDEPPEDHQSQKTHIMPQWLTWSSIQHLPGGWVSPYNAYQDQVTKKGNRDENAPNN